MYDRILTKRNHYTILMIEKKKNTIINNEADTIEYYYTGC